MPFISLFFGIRITMNCSEDCPPNFQAQYNNYQATIDIDEGTVLAGFLPNRQLKYVLAWCEMHKDELMQDWELSRDHKPLERIKPL